ncbi:MAG: F0F1 ATP synthase subunit A [Candidatus Omnitrophica bacterium]|nr:F0F1 ATP synthase subunit A [Candidatus Omnitrophota bacterium]
MVEAGVTKTPELPNIVTIAAEAFKETGFAHYLIVWENVIFSIIIIAALTFTAYAASRKRSTVPGRLQGFFEMFVGGVDDFVCGIIGKNGREYVPFIGTLFIYILCMNLVGLVPFMKSPSTSWSTTLALAICVFCYVQYVGFKELGFWGYIDHALGRPRGIIAFSVFIPIMMFVLHVVSELVKPISLSLRLRSNIWGDDMLLAVFAGFGLKGLPLLLFNSLMAIVVSVVQTLVFCLLTTVYFTLLLAHDDEASHA